MKNKMKVGCFEVNAKVDKLGLLHVTVKDATSRPLIHVDTDESGEFEDGSVTHSFTNNPAIVDYELRQSPGWCGKEDHRINPELLRKAAKDPIFCAWWSGDNEHSPEKYANSIEEMRRREGRDPATGELLIKPTASIEKCAEKRR